MSIYLSPIDPETDYQQLAELITRDSCEPVSVERLQAWNQGLPPGTVRLRVVATAACRRIAGFAEILHERCMPDGHFHFQVIVQKELRGRSIGGMLYDDLLQFALEQGAVRLSVDVLVGASDGLRFATRRGFSVAGGETADCPHYYRLVRDLP
ncbi:MAG: N-acetyltransferase family protein [Ktedonobacterales bacterium]